MAKKPERPSKLGEIFVALVLGSCLLSPYWLQVLSGLILSFLSPLIFFFSARNFSAETHSATAIPRRPSTGSATFPNGCCLSPVH